MINQRKTGAVLQYFQMGLSVIIGLFYTPFMIRALGQSEYGLYNTVVSTISMLSVLSLGFNSSYIRFFSKYRKENDREGIEKLNGLFLIVFMIIGIVALICGLFLSFHLEIVFDKGLTENEYSIARVLMLLLTINLAISFPMGVFQHIISAHEKFVFLKIVGMIRTVFGPLLTMPLLLMGYRSIAMVAVTLIISLIADGLYAFYVLVCLRSKFIFRGFERGLFRSLFTFTIFIAINMIVDQINWNVDKLLLGRYKGTAAVAVYAVGATLHSYYNMFSTSISNVFTPQIHRIINNTKSDLKKQKEDITSLFTRVGRIQFIVLGLIATGLLFFGKEFICHYWAGKEYEESYYVMLLLCLPTTIPLIQNLGIEIQRAQNLHQFRSIAYAVMAAINFGISIMLCQLYGAIGAAAGTAFSVIFANGVIMNIFYHKKCNIDVLIFWKNILRVSVGLIIPGIVGLLINVFVDLSSIVIFLEMIILYVLIYCASMYIFGMNQYERELIKNPLMKIIGCRKNK